MKYLFFFIVVICALCIDNCTSRKKRSASNRRLVRDVGVRPENYHVHYRNPELHELHRLKRNRVHETTAAEEMTTPAEEATTEEATTEEATTEEATTEEATTEEATTEEATTEEATTEEATTEEATTAAEETTTAAATMAPVYGAGSNYGYSGLVIPFINTGSSYFDAANTKVDAPVFNYGYYNYPKYLAPNAIKDQDHYRPEPKYESEEDYSPSTYPTDLPTTTSSEDDR